ncbi:tripartite tricarboxylate transporter permease [Sutcliffiella cohnii]|uniref:tripartite tricarboxylate transporter permease n=1 Tax=Sutcliffiella cohnii TaxID=33932 RepID=UPI002E1BD2CF|nr:tripartite tricarboxylate transporter permease [Sutcliffiella cohnii]
MEILHYLSDGLANVFTYETVLFLLLGVFVGQIVGILPGLGPVTGLALLIPITFGMNPIVALVMLTGVYYGAMFGGAITSILFNTPGDAAAVVTTFDGYPLTKQGKAGVAIGTAMFSSAIGGIVSVILIILLAPFLAKVALAFGPVEYTMLIAVSLLLIAGLTSKSKVKSAISTMLGLLLALVGQDPITGTPRFTFGFFELFTGIDFVIVALGLFAVAEIIISLENYKKGKHNKVEKVKSVIPTKENFKRILPPIRNGSLIGFGVGLLPGAGATIASFLSYSVAKRFSKSKEKFGEGNMEGVAAAESANNGSVGGAMVPMLTLGIPGSNSTAILLGGMMILGLQPGPMFFTNHPDIAWTVIVSMFVGIFLLLIMNTVLLRGFVQILKVPYSILSIMILVLAFLGAYSIHRSMFDVFLMGIFGVVGYFMKKHDFPLAPMVLTLVLGGILEQNLRRALTISDGSYSVFFTSPISVTLLLIGGGALFLPVIFNKAKKSIK